MGAGNYLPQYGDNAPFLHLNVDLPWHEGMDQDDQQFQYEGMLCDIRGVLPDSFWEDERWMDREERRRWRNGLFEVRTASWNNSEVIIVKALPDPPPFAGDNPNTWKHLRKLASAVFDAAAGHGYAWWRCCAWTGRPYTQGELLSPLPCPVPVSRAREGSLT